MKLPPLSQQRTALERAAGRAHFAFFMEQGTGKAYVGLAEAEGLYAKGEIDCLVIIAPNGVQLNWVTREAPKHLSAPYATLVWTGNHTKTWMREATAFVKGNFATEKPPLRILAMNIEAFSLKKSRAEAFLKNVAKRLRCYLVVDESSIIKNLGAACTRHVISCAPLAVYRRIMTGTPLTQSPLNFFSQFKFLKPGLLGFTEYVPFKAYYAEWRERVMPSNKKGALPGAKVKFSELVRYRNLDQLKSRVDRHSYTVTKADCLDLPPKVYETRDVIMSKAQEKLYTAALTSVVLQLRSDAKMTMIHAFTRMMRLSQITGGFVKADELKEAIPIPGENAKLVSLLQYIEEIPDDRKVIIWARFIPELRAIRDALGRARCALYWGEVDKQSRHENIDRFQNEAAVRFFVGNAKSGKFGITLTEASHVIYFSNDYSADARWQSEDRAHRIGQRNSVTYTDLTCKGTLDQKVLTVLLARKRLADLFKGSPAAMSEWLLEQESFSPAIEVVDVPPEPDLPDADADIELPSWLAPNDDLRWERAR